MPVAPAPQQLEQRVVIARDHDRDALGHGDVAKPELHPKGRGDIGREPVSELMQVGAVKDQAQEEAAALGVGGVLGGVREVGAAIAQERGNRGDDPRLVRARDEQAAGVAHGRRAGGDFVVAATMAARA
jgi:hypothetical protein